MIQQAENSKEKDRGEIKLRSFWLQRFLAYDVKDKITFGVAWLGLAGSSKIYKLTDIRCFLYIYCSRAYISKSVALFLSRAIIGPYQ